MEIGAINELNGQTSIEWKIPDYFSLSQKTDYFVDSPSFNFLDGIWCLRIYPNGQRKAKSVGYTGLYVVRSDPCSRHTLFDLKVGITCDVAKFFKLDSGVFFTSRDGMYGWPKFIERTELLGKRYEIAPKNILIIFCYVKVYPDFSDAASQTEFVDSVETLSGDFHTLLHDGRKSDVMIKVKDQTFHAHRLILGARSPVFAAMFEHDMKEACSGVIDIVDCTPDVFRDFLEFMYTGKIQNLTSVNVTDLFSLADKYDLRDLKEKCRDYMKDNLCLETACHILNVSDKHNEAELKNSAKKFIVKNIKKITSSEKWMLFVSENPVVATEILMAFVPKDRS